MPATATGMSLSDTISGYNSGLQQHIADEVKGLSEAKDTYERKIQAADAEEANLDPNVLKPPQMAPAPTPKATQPIEMWGSAAMWMAALGGLLTKRPLTNSLNAASAVLNAYHQQDGAAAQQAYDQWKTETENAVKMAQFSIDAYKTALSKIDSDKKAAATDFITTAKVLGDGTAAYVAGHYGIDTAVRYIDAMQSHVDRMTEAMPKIQLQNEQLQLGTKLLMAGRTLQAAQQSGDPAKIQAATTAFQAAQQDAQSFNTGIGKGGAGAVDTSTEQDRQAAGAQAATGMPLNQIVPGYGKQAIAARQQARSDAIDLIMKQNPGMSAADAGVEMANRSVEFQAGKTSEVKLNSMLGATQQAVKQLDYNIGQVTQEMKKLPSSNILPVINAIARGEEKWSGDPAYSSLFYYMSAAAAESARLLSGGQASAAQLHQGAQEEAQKWANINMTPASWAAVAEAMHDEGEYRVETYKLAKKSQSFGGSDKDASDRGPAPAHLKGKPIWPEGDHWVFEDGSPAK